MTSHQVEGGCCCGAIRYRIAAPPIGSMLCHCRTCRRVSAAPVVAWLSVAAHDFNFTRGHPALLATSPPVQRGFCQACGTHLTYTRTDSPGEVDVTTCSLDDPSAFPPTHHSWLAHDLAWAGDSDALPKFARSRYGTPQ